MDELITGCKCAFTEPTERECDGCLRLSPADDSDYINSTRCVQSDTRLDLCQSTYVVRTPRNAEQSTRYNDYNTDDVFMSLA